MIQDHSYILLINSALCLLTAICGVIAGFLARKAVKETQLLRIEVNHRLTELISAKVEAASLTSRAEGIVEGRRLDR